MTKKKDADAASVDPLSREYLDQRRRELKGRVGAKRFAHSEGVSDTAAELAGLYGQDESRARLAGLLHDWDKGYDDPGILARADDLGMELTDELRSMPRLLHGLTASRGLARDYPEIPADVLQAVDRHTLAASDMTDLDMIVYIADALEPHRKGGSVEKLRAMMGEVSLRELFVATYAHWMELMLERRKKMYSKTVEYWNAYMAPEGNYAPGFAVDAVPDA